MNPTRDKIINAALALAEKSHFDKIKQVELAEKSGVATGTIYTHFACFEDVKTAVVEAAVSSKNLKIIGQAVAQNHPCVVTLPPKMKRDALMQLI